MKDEQLKMEEIESSHLTHWVDVEGVDDILMSDTPQSVGPTESPDVRVKVWFKKKPMDLCGCQSEEHEHGVGGCVNVIRMSDTF